MDSNPRTNFVKKTDRGDLNKSLLTKLFKDLDLAHLVPNCDRGDARTYPLKKANHLGTYERPALLNRKSDVNKTISEIKPKISNVLDSGDSFKILRNTNNVVQRDKSRKSDYFKGKTSLLIVKEDSKLKTEKRACVLSEQLIKSNPEADRNGEITRHDEQFRKINENTKKVDEKTKTDKIKNSRLPPAKDMKINEKYSQNKAIIDSRKLLRQKYTVKLKSFNRNIDSKGNIKNDDLETTKQIEEQVNREKLNESPKNILQLIAAAKANKKNTEIKRKPMIKTILNNDNRVYKAVTFIDKSDQPATPLQIKMPISKKSVETNTVKNKQLKPITSKKSLQDKKEVYRKKISKEKKALRLKKRPISPDLPMGQGCPQTEVAKWAPCSINQHTKPYYEAWVDTTLTAISKCSEKEKQTHSKQNILRTFKRALEMESRPYSPDLIYEKVNDEKYMGRITVRKNR